MAAFWSLVLLVLFGATTLHTELVGRFDSMSEPIAGIVIPIIAVQLNGAFLIALAVMVAGVLAIHFWQQKPKVADLLIDTESELKKVAWPTLEEITNSSIVVIVCVVFLMAYLAGADAVLGAIARRVLLEE